MEFIADYGLFLAKAITISLSIILVVGSIFAVASKAKKAEKKGHIEVEKLNDHYVEMREALLASLLSHSEFKDHLKQQKAEEKSRIKQKKSMASSEPEKKRIFVVDFNGDIRASEVPSLEQSISAIIQVAKQADEVVVRLESAGGMVHAYGLAASQLARIRSKNIPLTVCVDKVAASGGYMMACIGDKIISAPFAVIGSIGVMAQLPNFHRLLKKHDVDYELITAGEYKRTLTIFGENTEKGREKFIQEIQDTHQLFKEFIQEYRPSVPIDDVSTGEVWFGKRAVAMKLVDLIMTSEEYLLSRIEDADIFKVAYIEKHTLAEKLGLVVYKSIFRVFDGLLHSDRESQIIR